MNSASLNAELFRELSYIANNENSMKKLLKYVKKLASQQKEEASGIPSTLSEAEAEYRPLTKAELIADVNEMCEEIKQIRAGKLKGRPAEELLNEL